MSKKDIVEKSGEMYLGGLIGNYSGTLALISNERGEILGYGIAGPSNHHLVGISAAVNAIRSSILDAMIRSRLGFKQINCLTLGLAGLDTRYDIELISSQLKYRLPAKTVILRDNSEIALAGALAGEPGIVVISRTGSIAAGMDSAGRYIRCGGWGYLLGDEGSSYDIGLQAIRAALREYDGRGESTRLTELIVKELGIENVEDLIRLAYIEKKLDLGRISSLADLVIKAAIEGDHVARHILKRAAISLAEMAEAVIKRLYLDEVLEEIKVAVVGKVFEVEDLILDPFKNYLYEKFKNVVVVKPRFPQVVGALIISYRHTGIKITSELLGNIERTLKRIPYTF